jgi:glycosyltransferase involved in cell wall biosynthesis
VPTACLVSFRLGGGDGVAIEAAKWAAALGLLGFDVVTVAGSGPVDVVVPGLAIDAAEAPPAAEVERALAAADLVVVENLCSLPLNPAASSVVAAACAGRPTVLHHHDLPWQRAALAHLPPPPDDPAWAHVTINELSRRELADRGVRHVGGRSYRRLSTIYNAFDPDPLPGDRVGIRRAFHLADSDRLLLQPTRALERKNVPAAVALTEAVDGVYWLLGPAEDGYGPELARVVANARCRVLLGEPPGGCTIADAYSACDAIVLPSSWEGFGNPSVESATHRRPLAIGPYPVADELAGFGFRWFDALEPSGLGAWLASPDEGLLEHNHAVAARSFNLADLPERLGRVLDTLPGL